VNIQAYQCKGCGFRTVISYGYCPRCREKDRYKEIVVNGTGTVFSFTKIHVAEERFQAETPYVLAVVEGEEGLRLIARIKQEDAGKLEIGSKVELDGWKDQVPVFKVN
jgi:uncharacterized OB-fold protein